MDLNNFSKGLLEGISMSKILSRFGGCQTGMCGSNSIEGFRGIKSKGRSSGNTFRTSSGRLAVKGTPASSSSSRSSSSPSVNLVTRGVGATRPPQVFKMPKQLTKKQEARYKRIKQSQSEGNYVGGSSYGYGGYYSNYPYYWDYGYGYNYYDPYYYNLYNPYYNIYNPYNVYNPYNTYNTYNPYYGAIQLVEGFDGNKNGVLKYYDGDCILKILFVIAIIFLVLCFIRSRQN